MEHTHYIRDAWDLAEDSASRARDEMIDLGVLVQTIDPYVMPSVLTDRLRLLSIRRRLAWKGWTILLEEETRTGFAHRVNLGDLR